MFYPFKNLCMKLVSMIHFTMGKKKYSVGYLGSLPEIIIPDIVDSKPVLNETKVTFGIRDQQLKTDLDKSFLLK